MLDSTRAVGESVIQGATHVKRLVVEILKATARCWSFFKDIHFSVYVIIPVISSFTSLNWLESMILWGLFFLPVLFVITFMALDSIFDLPAPESWPEPFRVASSRHEGAPSIIASSTSATKYRAHASGFGPLPSRDHMEPARRHRPTRPLRSRRASD